MNDLDFEKSDPLINDLLSTGSVYISHSSGKSWSLPIIHRITCLDMLKDALSFRQFSPNSQWEYLRLPISLFWWFYALIWMVMWGNWRRLRHGFWGYGWSRNEDPSPCVCDFCLWMGPRRWLYHGYQDDGSGEDVEAVDNCPRCDGEL